MFVVKSMIQMSRDFATRSLTLSEESPTMLELDETVKFIELYMYLIIMLSLLESDYKFINTYKVIYLLDKRSGIKVNNHLSCQLLFVQYKIESTGKLTVTMTLKVFCPC